ncbi:MAG: hypothetical protein IKO62_03450 [Bacteroidales bacterium]|nr:hypothetical protein [Bacteroidales bacterium]
MENKENISRRDALKRMSKTAIVVAFASVFSNVDVLANDPSSYWNHNDYKNYNNYKNYGNYSDYYNYNNYSNYENYTNYRDYTDCH